MTPLWLFAYLSHNRRAASCDKAAQPNNTHTIMPASERIEVHVRIGVYVRVVPFDIRSLIHKHTALAHAFNFRGTCVSCECDACAWVYDMCGIVLAGARENN